MCWKLRSRWRSRHGLILILPHMPCHFTVFSTRLQRQHPPPPQMLVGLSGTTTTTPTMTIRDECHFHITRNRIIFDIPNAVSGVLCSLATKDTYIASLHEALLLPYRRALTSLRQGLLSIIPAPTLRLYSANQLETQCCIASDVLALEVLDSRPFLHEIDIDYIYIMYIYVSIMHDKWCRSMGYTSNFLDMKNTKTFG